MRPGNKTAKLKRKKRAAASRQWEKTAPEKVQADIERLCRYTGKETYPGRKQALGAASWHKKRFGKTYTVYKCPHCNEHHLTTQEQREKVWPEQSMT